MPVDAELASLEALAVMYVCTHVLSSVSMHVPLEFMSCAQVF